jgi:hypothetical protein
MSETSTLPPLLASLQLEMRPEEIKKYKTKGLIDFLYKKYSKF